MFIILCASLTEEEALAILQKVRDIEQARPETDVKLGLIAPEWDREQSKRLLARVQPPFAHQVESPGASS